ncbi:aminoglycoside phosphotransferase family protein [Mesobacillus boroniphilus]|uniref:Aminoglycoside phosphotransferase family protein n=1 Tax=Mesobacillus boroniphilus TaxID=308892 RepID=A0A944CJL9_9BACI|nr:aminoglycoside phosphotransferase family protein [Mesobacillus boroniphilus]
MKRALKAYGVGQKSITIKQELSSWSTDLHYKIEADGKTYSARFLKENRSPNNVFGEITDEILTEQTKFCRFLLDHDVPFMRNVPALNGEPYTIVSREGEHYRFIMFEWIEGQHLTHSDKDMAWKFGYMARRFHDISATYKSAVFPKKSHLIGYQQFSDQIGAKIHSTEMQDKSELQDYLELANNHIATAKTNRMDYIVQSDLNPMNVLWDENRNIVGIVDFESIGYGDRIEGLAWLIKWYTRTEGINSMEMSSEVAKSLLDGYGAFDFLGIDAHERLASLLWLSGCLNWNFVKTTLTILDTHNVESLNAHLHAYKIRGEKLISLLPKAFLNV